jgi:hypothetical protein
VQTDAHAVAAAATAAAAVAAYAAVAAAAVSAIAAVWRDCACCNWVTNDVRATDGRKGREGSSPAGVLGGVVVCFVFVGALAGFIYDVREERGEKGNGLHGGGRWKGEGREGVEGGRWCLRKRAGSGDTSGGRELVGERSVGLQGGGLVAIPDA